MSEKFVPYPYQSYCIKRIVQDPILGLFQDMGLGKTVETLSAILELRYNRWAISKALVVAPKKVAEGTWTAEAARWDHTKRLRISTVLGSQTQRLQALATPADIYVINRDNIAWLVDHYRNDWPFDMVVLDESTSFKNASVKRSKALALVRSRIKRMVLLTGTPSPNGLEDLWGQIYLLDGGQRLYPTLGQFQMRYFDPDRRSRTRIFSYRPKEGAEQAIMERIGDICVSMKAEDYLQMPDLIYDDVPVVLDAKAAAAYKRLEKTTLLPVDESMITAKTAGILSGKLLQLCNGAVYDEQGQALEIHKCKIKAFLTLLERLNGQPALVAYSYQHDRDRLLRALGKTQLRTRLYSGPEDKDAWNTGGVDVLLAHPASCAYGLNLQQGGCHVVWFGLTWSLELYEQFNKRLHRQGQKRPVIVHHLITRGGRDEDVMAALRSKGNTQETLMQSLKARIQKVKEGDAQ